MINIIPQNEIKGQEIKNKITNFFKTYKISKLISACNGYKQKGFSVIEILTYLVTLVFSDRSMYMQMRTNTFKEKYSKNTVYRFLNDNRINWQKFVDLLSLSIIKDFFTRLTSEDRKDVFVIDDTLFDRSSSKKVEMLVRVFDHNSCKFKKRI